MLAIPANLSWSEASTIFGVPLTAITVAYLNKFKSKAEKQKLTAQTADIAMHASEKAMRILEEALKYQAEQIDRTREQIYQVEKQHNQCLVKLFEHEQELNKIKMTLGKS